MKVGDLVRGSNGYGLGIIIKIKAEPGPVVHDLIYKVQFLKDGEWHWLTPAYLEAVNESR